MTRGGIASRSLFRPATARGWDRTNQESCTLHETRTLVEHTRLPASSAPTPCSTRRALPEQPAPPASGNDDKTLTPATDEPAESVTIGDFSRSTAPSRLRPFFP